MGVSKTRTTPLKPPERRASGAVQIGLGVSPKLTSQWVGPGEVLEQLSDVVYRVRICARGRVVVLHRDRLAPYRPLAAGLPDTPSSPSTAPLTPTSPPT